MGRLIDMDPVTKTRLEFHALGDGKFVVNEVQDVEGVTEANKARYNLYDERTPFGDKMGDHHVARIPLQVLNDLHRKGILYDEKAMKRWLNDPDNRAFRTRPGRV